MKSTKRFQLLAILLIVSIASFAQKNIFTAKVTDVMGEGIPGATITVTGGNSVVADAKGVFSISFGDKSSLVLTVSSIGYKSIVKTIAIGDINGNISFQLEEDKLGLNTIVVTATNSSRRTLQAMPVSITSYSESKLAKIKFNSNADILRGIPGITAEGGGGEVAANIFVRGLPSGGQYQFSPLQIDGMPVISTMGMTSSAPDVYFRNDIGISRLEFVRGGSATLYGAGSVAGIINFTSKIGSDVQKSTVEMEYATPGKAKFDFNTGGAIAEKLYYNITGTYRYDNGPIKSGIPSNGYQFRTNIRKVTDNGSFTLYAQYINDQVQFYSPFHLTGNRTLPTGWDGETINTMETPDVVSLSVKTPNGFYQSRAGNAVSTKGGYIMADMQHQFNNDWKLGVKLRTANYKHEFNFFNTDGNGRNPLSQATFQTTVAATGTNPVYTYASDNSVVPSNALILENIVVDRNRPMNEIAAQWNITKTINGNNSKHTINLGSFMSRTNSIDYNVQIRYLSEYRDRPRILNMSYTNASSVVTNYTTNGVVSVPGYTNRDLTSNKIAFFLTDEIVAGNWNIDAGFRIEQHAGRIIAEKTSTAANADGRSVAWGNGAFDRFNLRANDWATAIGISYKVQKQLSVYGNFSRGYFFPEYRGYSVKYKAGVPVYPVEKPEHITQGELGLKLGNKKLTATLAGFYVSLKDRYAVNLVTIAGVLRETQSLQSSKTYGVEATYDYEFAKNFHFTGTLTLQNATYTQFLDSSTATPIDNKGKWLERQPHTMYSPAISFDNKKFYLGFTTDYVDKRYGNAANLVSLSAYSLSRFDAAYTFNMKSGESLRFSAGVFNVFNSAAVTEGNPRAGNTQTNTGDFFVGRVSLPRSLYMRVGINF